ncbi:MAG: hypothetical protein GY772_02720, partial [bacterium]|nr:hypothetical protein [bacterium]
CRRARASPAVAARAQVVFVCLGISAFTTGDGLGAVVGAALPVLAGGGVAAKRGGAATSGDGEDKAEQEKEEGAVDDVLRMQAAGDEEP